MVVSERQNVIVLRVDLIQIGFEVCLFSFSVLSQLYAMFILSYSGRTGQVLQNFVGVREVSTPLMPKFIYLLTCLWFFIQRIG